MNATVYYSLQQQDFSLEAEYQQLCQQFPSAGAIVTFTGLVRDISSEQHDVAAIELTTYQAMTRKQLASIGEQAVAQFDIEGVRIIHRYGKLNPTEQIVFVGVASKHRQQAFAAAQMTMDFLKSQTAFWKKEISSDGERWIEPTHADLDALKQWQK